MNPSSTSWIRLSGAAERIDCITLPPVSSAASSTKTVTSLSYAEITRAFTGSGKAYEATVVAPNHGFSEGAMVTLSGVKLENNVVELAVRILNSDYGHDSGIGMYGTRLFLPAYPLLAVIIGGNVARNVNDAFFPNSRAIEIFGCEKAIVQNNIIGVDRATAIEQSSDSGVTTFNNLKPDGTLVRCSGGGSSFAPEVVKEIEAELGDVTVSSLLK